MIEKLHLSRGSGVRKNNNKIRASRCRIDHIRGRQDQMQDEDLFILAAAYAADPGRAADLVFFSPFAAAAARTVCYVF